jgi:predicted nuclease of predicted toxin-antitoxin system
MRFKIDENLPKEIAEDLRAAGHDADTVPEQGMTGAADSVVLARVQAEARTILTLDKGIADVRAYPPDQFAGIILFRPHTTARAATLTFVRQHLPTLLLENLSGHLYVVSEVGIRRR